MKLQYYQFLMRIFDEKTDGGCRINPLADLENAEAIVVLGADPNHSVPVFSYYLKRAARQGTPIIVVDPRRTELVNFASMWLQPKLHTDLEFLNALAAILHEKKSYDLAFIDKFTEGFQDKGVDLTLHNGSHPVIGRGLGRDLGRRG